MPAENASSPAGAATLRAGNAIATLRRFTRAREPEEHCELCNARLASSHRHLLDMNNGQAVCSCYACAMRFANVLDGRFKLMPREPRALPGFRLSDEAWEGFSLPINLAFFFRSSRAKKMMAFYPSPAGPMESLLTLNAWEDLVRENTLLAEMQSDVEALLVNRVGGAHRYFIAPMDACYELVGLIRMHWRGLSGGEAVWREIEAFFNRMEAASR